MIYGVIGNQQGWYWKTILEELNKIITKKEDVIVSGGAEGVDTFAQEYAKRNGLSIIIHYPDPDKPSPKRYFDRNYDIAKDCDVLIAFDKKSGRAGTKNTVAYAKRLGKKVIEFKEERLNKNEN